MTEDVQRLTVPDAETDVRAGVYTDVWVYADVAVYAAVGLYTDVRVYSDIRMCVHTK